MTTDPRAAPLPRPVTLLLGRAPDIETAVARLNGETARLLTLTGTGGVGKTRLALAVAATMAEAFGAGVGFIRLDVVSDPALVPSMIVRGLGLSEMAAAPTDQIAAHVGDARFLLVLD